ncbi:Iron hydrogenase [Amanita muscaria]
MTFSGALTLTDLNDFISPSQACIKPVQQSNSEVPEPGGATVCDSKHSSGGYYEVSSSQTQRKLEQAQISLNDCLACSGCITSAESVLITSQSHAEVLAFLAANENKAVPVISIAPQSLASLAASLPASVTLHQVLRRVRTFCKEALGFAHVFDITFARHVSLKEHVREFEERRQGSEASKLPMMASACPGWICYAEKAHSEMLPYISRTKSPQQVMGTLVKYWLGEKWEKRRAVTCLPNEIYHVSVMPCYDKKLEASREDFRNEEYATRDVDCVITTGELDLMMRDKGWDLSVPVIGESDDEEDDVFPTLLQHPGSSSGSYLQAIVNHVVKTWPVPLEASVKIVRNADFEEYTLQERDEGKIVFKGAKCYGFRNLQNVVRKVGKGDGLTGRRKTRKEAERGYDYVEVMACAAGCVNGGGQLKRGEGNREWTKEVEGAYWRSGRATEEGIADELALEVMGQGLEFRTQYRAVESDVIGTAVKW